MNPFRYKDASNNYIFDSPKQEEGTMSTSEHAATIQDLQQSLERVTDDRDRWRKIAMALADNARASATKYYARSREYIFADVFGEAEI